MRVSHSVAPDGYFCTNMWIETNGRADFKLMLETQVKLLVTQCDAKVGGRKYPIDSNNYENANACTDQPTRKHAPAWTCGKFDSGLQGVCGCVCMSFCALAESLFVCACQLVYLGREKEVFQGEVD